MEQHWGQLKMTVRCSLALTGVAQWVWVSAPKVKGHGVYAWVAGQVPGWGRETGN